jgi:homoserine O-succinyltransferase
MFRRGPARPDRLDIGLVNNMPDTALRATERQFDSLLRAAGTDVEVRLWLFALPAVPRADWAQDYVRAFYVGLDELWRRRLDGLIVTGAEPRAADLRDEPYWEQLTRVLEWAGGTETPTIWSCLAAQAAVLHLDGVRRVPFGTKRFGVFACAPVSGHFLAASLPPRMEMPQSRWNNLPADTLRLQGYRMLVQSDDGSADAFVKDGSSFVFFQGHPEYDDDALLLEYRRDIRRFLRGERDTYPPLPQRYFDHETIGTLLAFRQQALEDRREELLAEFSTGQAASRVANAWRPAAVRLYRNWLTYLLARWTANVSISAAV